MIAEKSGTIIMCVYRTLFVTVCVCHTGLIKATCLLAMERNVNQFCNIQTVTSVGKNVKTCYK